uniref:PB1 domain-containing protein n=1 Tax=Oryza glumipatula TaxID=40148 RepID=A0A0E0BIQ8_9ORYZ
MVGTSSWSSSSSSSLGSLDDDIVVACVVKAADAAVEGACLQRKLREMCGWEAVCLRCQLPTEDLDALVSVTGDDDLANLLEEYDAASRDRLQPLKIRAFLFSRTTATTTAPLSRSPSPTAASRTAPRAHYQHQTGSAPSCASRWAARQMSLPPARVPHQQQHYNRHGGDARPQRYLVQSASSRW